ncbi:MAG TPA: hypothetical protein VF152_12760 [Acidimicrobiia bacterium]
MRRAIIALVSVPMAVLGLAACGDDGGDGGETVDVLLSEFIVEPDPTEVSAGEIEFVADNQGGEVHELVVVRADSAEDLPTDADGAVDEAQIPEADQLGEIEDIQPGDSATLTLDLEAGTYVLLCNIVEEEDGEVESHFAEGMHAPFTVT